MGRRGPAPTPTAILKIRGSRRATRKRLESEVQPPEGRPEQPDWLDADAKAVWDELVPLLDTMRVLTPVDRNALARYCRLWSRWRKCEDFIAKHGEVYTIKDEQGKVKCVMPWPQAVQANKLAQQLTRLEQEFGMTPSARTRVQARPLPETPEQLAKRQFFANW